MAGQGLSLGLSRAAARRVERVLRVRRRSRLLAPAGSSPWSQWQSPSVGPPRDNHRCERHLLGFEPLALDGLAKAQATPRSCPRHPCSYDLGLNPTISQPIAAESRPPDKAAVEVGNPPTCVKLLDVGDSVRVVSHRGVAAAVDSQDYRAHRFRASSFGGAHSLGTAGRRVGECG
jgi:hypothetical protein